MAAGLITAVPKHPARGRFFRTLFLIVLTASGPWAASAEAQDRGGLQERAVLEAVNIIRADGRIGALVPEEAAAAAADAHAGELLQRRTLSHRGLDGSRVNERYRRAGGTALVSGEILAAGDSIESLTAGWMQSASHRESLMDPRWTSAGVGLRDLGAGRILVVVVFTESRWRTRSVSTSGGSLVLKGNVVGASVRERSGAHLVVDGTVLRPEADPDPTAGNGAVVFRIPKPAAWDNGGIATAFFGFDRDERPTDLVLLARP